MNTQPGIFSLPRDWRLTDLVAVLDTVPGLRAVPLAGVRASRELLDTFDWRLHEAGLRLEWLHARSEACLRLHTADGDAAPVEVRLASRPRAVADLPPASMIRRRLARVVEPRALLVRAQVGGTLDRLELRDGRDKTVVRVEAWRLPRTGVLTVAVVPMRGFATHAARAGRALAAAAPPGPPATDPLVAAARSLPVPPGAYPSWRLEGLDARLRTDDALQRVLGHYARVMALNIPGARDHVDPEFLHDFRVGLRRTRTLIARVPGVFPQGQLRPFVQDLAWLGNETTLVRDADMHALAFPGYAAALRDPALDTALQPLWVRVLAERDAAWQRLAAVLDSARFARRWAAWLRFLDRPAPRASRQPAGPLPLAGVAANAIRKAVRRVRRKGARIGPQSPPESYHEVRKLCKNLRYLIDAFEEAVPDVDFSRTVKRLKELQDILGEHQDLEVHLAALARFDEAMVHDTGLPAETHAAMERLLGELGARAQHARGRFAAGFARFPALKLERALRALAQ